MEKGDLSQTASYNTQTHTLLSNFVKQNNSKAAAFLYSKISTFSFVNLMNFDAINFISLHKSLPLKSLVCWNLNENMLQL